MHNLKYMGALFAIALALVLPVSSRGQDCIEYADYTPVNHTIVFDSHAFAYHDNHLFSVDEHYFLQVLDVSDPAAMTLVAEIAAPYCEAQEIAIVDGFAYVLTTHALHIIDISIPTAPVVVGTVDSPSNTRAIAADTTLVYVLATSGLTMYDISDPTKPTPTGSTVSGNFQSIDVVSGIAYLGCQSDGLQIVDVSDPNAPIHLATLPIADRIAGVHVIADRLYVGASDLGLEIYDVQNPASPAFLGSVEIPGSARQVAVANGVAYVVDYAGGLCLVDVTDPGTPRVASFAQTRQDPVAMALGPDWVYVHDTVLTYAFEISSFHLDPVGSFISTGPVIDLAVSNSIAYLAGDQALWTFDLTDPVTPEVLGSCMYEVGAHAQGLDIAGDYAYIAARHNGLQIIDVSQPSEPVLVHTIAVDYISQDVAVDGGYAFLLTSNQHDLLVFDLVDPMHPVQVASLPVTGYSYELVPGNGHLYVAGSAGLKVIDITDPLVPAEVAVIDLGMTAGTVTCHGDRLYVGSFNLQIFDVSVPASPVEIAGINLESEIRGIAVTDDFIYSHTPTHGAFAVDIADPLNPTIIGGLPIAGIGWAAQVTPDRLLVASGYSEMLSFDFGGLYSLPLQCVDQTSIEDPEILEDSPLPAAVVLHPVTPNPFNPRTTIAFDLREAERVSLAIYDLQGRCVVQLVDASYPAGRHEINWHGVDDQGRMLPSGVFLMRLVAGGVAQHGRLTLVR